MVHQGFSSWSDLNLCWCMPHLWGGWLITIWPLNDWQHIWLLIFCFLFLVAALLPSLIWHWFSIALYLNYTWSINIRWVTSFEQSTRLWWTSLYCQPVLRCLLDGISCLGWCICTGKLWYVLSWSPPSLSWISWSTMIAVSFVTFLTTGCLGSRSCTLLEQHQSPTPWITCGLYKGMHHVLKMW